MEREVMNVVLFGATGMIGQGVLRECLLNEDVRGVVSVVRNPSGQQHKKLQELIAVNFLDFSSMAPELTGLDACIYCLGVSSAGMTEQEYTRITFDYTMEAARSLLNANPEMAFLYVSGAGTDGSESGRTMWARVKGKTENALLRLGFKAAYMFRPGFIQPLHGIQSKTRLYRTIYAISTPIFPVLSTIFPRYVTTTEQLGRAMLAVARDGYRKPILEMRDISEF
jgi:uncharacterized protein YbjT (DUF2867 family)